MSREPRSKKADGKKSKADLIAELEALRRRVGSGGMRREEEAQGFSSGQLFSILKSADDAIISMDESFRIRIFSDGAERIFGYTAREVLGKPLDMLLPKGTRRAHREHVRHFGQARDSSRRMSERGRISGLRKNGERFAAQASISRVDTDEGRFFTAILSDISKQARGEAALAASEEEFRNLLEGSIQGVLIHRNAKPVFVNEACAQIFGYEKGDEILRLKKVDALVSPEFRPQMRAFRKARALGKPVPAQYQFRGMRKDGSPIWVDNIVRVVTWEGEPAIQVSIIDITARREAEEKLERQRVLLENIFEALPVGILVRDRKANKLLVNQARAAPAKLTPEAFLTSPRKFPNLISPAEIREMERIQRKVLSKGEAVELVRLRRRPDGGEEYVRSINSPFYGEDGKIAGVISVSENVTDRVRAEAALAASEEQFRNLLEGSIQGVLIHRDAKPLFANEACAGIFGYDSVDELLALEDTGVLVSPRDREMVMGFAKARQKGETVPAHYEFQGQRKDGSPVWLDNIARPVTWDGEPAVQSTFVNITKRKRAEEQLRASQALLQTVFDNLPVGVFMKNRESRYLMVNKIYAANLGREPEQLINAHPQEIEFATPEQQEKIVARDQQVFSTGEKVEVLEVPLTDSNGTTRWWHLIKVPLFNEAGEITGIVGIRQDITERKKAGETVRESESRMRLLTNAVPVMISYIDADKRFRFANTTHQRWMAAGGGDYIGKKITEVQTPEAYRVIQPFLERALAGEEVDYEAEITFPDGRTRKFHSVNIPDVDEHGRVRGFSSMTEDVTERRRAEEELKAGRRLLQTVFDAMPELVSVKDAEGRYAMVNRAFAEAFGTEAGKFPGLLPSDLEGMDTDWMRTLQEADRQVLETGLPVTLEEGPLAFPTGAERYGIAHKVPLRDETGATVGVVTINHDITEIQRAQAALRESEERFRATLDHSPSAVWLKDLEGRFVLANRRLAEWTGVPLEDFPGKTSYDFFPAEDAAAFEAHDRDVLNSGGVIERELEVPIADGTRRTMVNTKFPVSTGNGKVVGVGAIMTDVTGQKKTEEQLRESQKMEAVGQLAGGIAHDFNNMLQIIINYSHLASENLADTVTVGECLERILRAGERSANLTHQLLAYGRKNIIQAVPLDLNALTANLMKMVGRVIGEGIELVFRQSHDLHPVEADPGMLEQVLLNLCLNARDAMPNGGKIVIETQNVTTDEEFLETHNWARRGAYVMLSVSDNGVGIADGDAERVFEPFFTTKDVGEGTGLGLAVAYGIVRQHRGAIEVFSEPGAGSTFQVYLPAAAASEIPAPRPSPTIAPGGSETVLVAEDEEEVRQMLARILKDRGYTVLTARDGREAVEVFKANPGPVDLVVLDMVMPVLGGREAFERIRRINPGVAVLFNSGYSADAVDTSFIAETGLHLIQKPYTPNNFLTAVREALGGKEPPPAGD